MRSHRILHGALAGWLLLAGPRSHATAPQTNTFKCRIGTTGFDLRVEITINPDDVSSSSRLWVVQSSVPVAIELDADSGFETISGGKDSVCAGALAFVADHQRLLVPLIGKIWDAQAQLAAFMYDPAKRSAVAVESHIGDVVLPMRLDNERWTAQPPAVMPLRDGFRFLDSSRCEELGSGSTILGHKAAAEKSCALPLWFDVAAGAAGFRRALNRELTFKRSELKPYFGSKQEFESYFHLTAPDLESAEARAFREYRLATLDDGRTCLSGRTGLRCRPGRNAP